MKLIFITVFCLNNLLSFLIGAEEETTVELVQIVMIIFNYIYDTFKKCVR